MEPQHAWALALALVGALALVQTARLAWARASTRWRLRARRQRGAAGEREAEGLLEAAGYRIDARQPRASLEYALDGEPVTVEVRADLLVSRGGRTLLVEVKTGASAPRLRTRATRRQLLEYAHAFEVDGLLLVDADHDTIAEVTVPTRASSTRARGSSWGLAALALVLGLMLGAWAGHEAYAPPATPEAVARP